MACPIVGRSGELEAIRRLLDRLAAGPAALVFEGEPGIGKTTLIRVGVGEARRCDARVLFCAASESETRLSYAALADLFGGIDAGALAHLPAPQRDALDAALLRAGPRAGGVNPRAVATAALSTLEALAEERAVVVAIDDAQWLDRATARVVEFCARRLAGRVGLLVSRRTRTERSCRIGRNGIGGPDDVEVCRLGPLDDADVQRLLRARDGGRIERRLLVRLAIASGGNPFYALELARAMPAGGTASPALILPTSLEEIVAARIAKLDEDVMEALLAVAAAAEPTVERLERTLGPRVATLLDEAEERRVVERDGPRVRFTHPLLATGVYARAGPARRRAMHRRLARDATDLEERARHLAFGGAAPDAIRALDEAARHAHAHGAPETAAELLELAIGLGGGHDVRVRAARHHFDAGDSRRARALLDEAIAGLPAGRDRARALLLLAEVRYKDDRFPAARGLLEQARTEAGTDASLRVMVDLRRTFVAVNVGAVEEAVAPARSALADARRLADPGLLAQALAVSAMVDFSRGLGLDEDRLARALELEDPALDTANEFLPSLIAAFLFLWTDRFDATRALLDAIDARHAARGEQHALAWLRGFLRVSLECSAGELGRAEAAADEGTESLLQLDTIMGRGLARAARARLDACAGRADAAREAATEALDLFARAGAAGFGAWTLAALGFLELSLGRHDAAAGVLGPVVDVVAATGLPEPAAGGALMAGDAAEALIAVGRAHEAETVVSLLEQRGAALGRTWAIAVGARCRGLLLAVDGDLAGAEQALERALAAHERLPMPLERARTLLVLGRIRRRRRQRLDAKAALEEAHAIFERVGSPHWAAQAQAEIECLGLRPRVSADLTPAEERVAVLAASGLTNHEVAASLIVSPKTVEAQLARAYRKLGIRSRAELGARMALGPGPAQPPLNRQ